MTLGDIIKEYRVKTGMSMGDFAEIAGMSRAYVNILEKNYNPISGKAPTPSLSKIKQVADAIGMNVNDVIDAIGDDQDIAINIPDEITPHMTQKTFPVRVLDLAKIDGALNEKGHTEFIRYGTYLTKQDDYAAKEDDVQAPVAQVNADGLIEIRVYDQPAAAGLGNYIDVPESHIEQFPPDWIPGDTDFGIRISGDSMEPLLKDGCTAFVRADVAVESGKVGIFVLNGASLCKQIIVDEGKRTVKLHSQNHSYRDIIIGEDDYLKTIGTVLGSIY